MIDISRIPNRMGKVVVAIEPLIGNELSKNVWPCVPVSLFENIVFKSHISSSAADGSFIITARKETVLHHEIACFRKYNDSAANIETKETYVL